MTGPIGAWARYCDTLSRHAEGLRARKLTEAASREISAAAKEWAESEGYTPPRPAQERRPAPAGERRSFVVPFGDEDKGKPLEKASTDTLRMLSRVLPRMIDEPARAKYRDQNEALLEAVELELDAR